MTWVEQHYTVPTYAQLEAEQAIDMLNELDVKCSCVYGEAQSKFEWPGGVGLPKGTLLPSWVPVLKMCRKCELSNLLWHIADPDDRAGDFT